MSAKPTKAQLLRAMWAIHAKLEAVTYGPNGNSYQTLGGIQYWVEETLGKKLVNKSRDAIIARATQS
jgi:hypothetical protein